MMKILPSRRQWNEWSLPSKLTAVGAYISGASLLITLIVMVLSALKERSNVVTSPRPAILELRLALRISGFQIHVANTGTTPARQVTITLTTWQVGAPGPDIVKEFSVRDLSTLDDVVLDRVEMVDRDNDRRYARQRDNWPTCGYLVVRSINTARPRAWAFFMPPANQALPDSRFTGQWWPIVEFDYPRNRPESSPCVDFPRGICADYHKTGFLWAKYGRR